jgi:L-threonylcarbamoyladenylate synthase
MWYCLVDAQAPASTWSDTAVALLRAGGVLAFPTDTLYGLACDPRNPAAVAKLYRIKGRASDQAIPLIAADEAQIVACGASLGPTALRLAARFWPGPLSLVVPAWASLCQDALGGQGTVAVRVPDHPVARALAAALGYPVTSTSANRSGEPPTRDPLSVLHGLGADIDGLIDGGASPGGPPSTMVDVTGETPRLVRAGAVPWDRVLESVSDCRP